MTTRRLAPLHFARPRVLLLAALALLGAPREMFAQQVEGTSLVGKKVITRKGTVLKVDDKVVYDEGRGERLKLGLDQRKPHTYKVRKAREGEVWLSTGDVTAQGWTPISNIILLDEAIAYIDEATREKPESPEACFDRALIWQALGKTDKALDQCNAAIRLIPRDDRKFAYLFRGLLRAEEGRYEDAVEDCTEAIQLDPRYVEAYVNRGAIRIRSGSYDNALEDFNKAIEIDPRSARAYYNRGVVWTKRKEYDLAFADYDQAVQLDPAYALARCGRGGAWARRGEYDRALPDLDEAIRLDPDLANAYKYRGVIWYDKQKFSKAADDFGKAIELDPSRADFFTWRSSAWFGMNEYGKAVEDGTRAIQINPNDASMYYGRATIWNLLGEHGKAIADLTRAIEINPDLKSSRLCRGITRIAMDDLAAAAGDFGHVIGDDPGSPSAFYYRAVAAFEQGYFDLAIEDVDKAMAFGRSHAATYRLRGDAWYAKWDYEKAIANLDYAAGQDPLDHEALDGLAWILATATDERVRDGGRAVESATRACQLTDWKTPEHLATLAASFAEVRDFENAVKRQQAAIDLTEDPPTQELRRERLALYAAKQPFHVDPGPRGARDVMSPGERRASLTAFVNRAILSEHDRARREAASSEIIRRADRENTATKAPWVDRAAALFKP
ncbi:tetratricopeptide repeat protein [Paludisphaera borealis]|uniref:TPR repeat-containing protein YrrB n=1 Tax=Paludisphaera borealis TaxID=1387353 RepID=A0A1U7CQJ4_9BACT|nr:tetratricopeptide repeat protein [Paludisphaera borealis]APW61202.1 TPR repeat-containing protein YrrB [Paludisphaera borealis]